ncbi:MAG: hypothetical protein D6730_13715 [Bacteroidetes bacterium]|nr:MAG: hypothetical protein D6730_13715 [Bacteroidota bacterium]
MGLFSFIRNHRKKMKSVTAKQVIAIALQNDGKITPAVLAAHTPLRIWQASMKLQGLHGQGVFATKYDYRDNSYTFVLKKPELYKNLDLSTSQPAAPPSNKQLTDAEVIQWAYKARGRITPAILCIKAEVSIDEARQKLQELQHKGVFDIQATDSGALVYVLNELDTFQDLMAD